MRVANLHTEEGPPIMFSGGTELLRQVILDTETTGLSENDRVIEIGCVELHNRSLTGRQWHTYLRPDRAIHPDASRIHGIYDADLLHRPRFPDVAKDFIEFIRDAEVIAHNIDFDMGMLNREFERAGMKERVGMVAGKITDTLKLARSKFPGKSNNLDALRNRLGVIHHDRELHGALIDALILSDVWLALTRKQENLDLSIDNNNSRIINHEKIDNLSVIVVRATPDELASQRAMLDKNEQLKKGPARFLMGEMEGEVIAAEPGD